MVYHERSILSYLSINLPKINLLLFTVEIYHIALVMNVVWSKSNPLFDTYAQMEIPIILYVSIIVTSVSIFYFLRVKTGQAGRSVRRNG